MRLGALLEVLVTVQVLLEEFEPVAGVNGFGNTGDYYCNWLTSTTFM